MRLFKRKYKKPELELVAHSYRDINRNRYTQVTATCKCGRGGWIRLPHHYPIAELKKVQKMWQPILDDCERGR